MPFFQTIYLQIIYKNWNYIIEYKRMNLIDDMYILIYHTV